MKINLEDKLTRDISTIAINGKEFKVNKTKNAVLKVLALLDEGDSAENIDKAVELLVGAEFVSEMNELSFSDYKTAFIGVMAAAMDMTFEDAKARFDSAQTP